MKCITWSTGYAGCPRSSWQLMELYSPFSPRFPGASTRSRQTTAGRGATGSTAAALPAGEALHKRRLCTPKWSCLNLPHCRKHCHRLPLSYPDNLLCASRIISSAPFSAAMDAILLLYSLTAKHQAARGIWDFLQNITIHKKQRKKKRSFSKVWFFRKEFPF